MFDHTDLDLRIGAHQDQIDTVNQSQWQRGTVARPAGALRHKVAAALVALAAMLDGATPRQAVKREPIGGFAG